MIRRIKNWIVFSMIVSLGLFAWLAYYAISPLKLQPNSQEITIQPKSGLRNIANQLVKQGVLNEPWRFIIIARLLNKQSYLQAGSYTLNKNVSPYQLLLSLNHGKTTQGSITFIEGRTFAQMQEKIVQGRIEKTLRNYCLFDQPFIKNQDITIEELIKQTVSLLGESIKVARFTRYVLGQYS